MSEVITLFQGVDALTHEESRAFLHDVLNTSMSMSLDLAELRDDVPLGSGGLELESLSLAELVTHIEDYTGIRVPDEKLSEMASMDVGQFLEYVDGISVGGRPR